MHTENPIIPDQAETTPDRQSPQPGGSPGRAPAAPSTDKGTIPASSNSSLTPPDPAAQAGPARSGRGISWRTVGVLLCAAALIPVWRAIRVHARPAPVAARTLPALPVAVARVTRQDLYDRVQMAAEFRPYMDVELHAKVSGYVRDMKVDFGDRVKVGQLLATLEVPELEDELHNAIATEERAEADYTNASLIHTRLVAVNQATPNAVAEQEIDTAEAKERSALADIAAAKADVEKYQTLVGYTRITAPFRGVITWRYADPGALIQAGTASDTQTLPLVRISDDYRLRLDIPVDLKYVKDVKVGEPVEVRVDSLGGKTFTGKITRCSRKVDDATRTMITEVEVPNPALELVPGMYAYAILKLDDRPRALAVPTEAVSGDKKKVVYLINAQQEIEERLVTLGLETPDSYEVLSGLKEGDLVLVGDRSQVRPGQKVLPKLAETLAQE